MKNLIKLLLLGSMGASLLISNAQATFVPQNEIDYSHLSRGAAQIDEAEFNKRIADLMTVYKPVVSKLGGRLSIEGSWKNDKFVAQATQMFGSWRIQFSGGIARRPELTPDGMTLIICHELGHHLAGFPFSDQGPIGSKSMANEGQADYYSTKVCNQKMWGQDLEKNMEFRDLVPAVAKVQCDSVYNGQAERDLCYRTATATQSIMETMAGLMNKPAPAFETPDLTVATQTANGHPKVQCRMDTLLQGSICLAPFDEKVIPGKGMGSGINNSKQEEAAKNYACLASTGYTVGLRPACWFKSKL